MKLKDKTNFKEEPLMVLFLCLIPLKHLTMLYICYTMYLESK